MLRPFIVGLGRAGLGLHWHVLRRLQRDGAHRELFSAEPALVWDARDIRAVAKQNGLEPVRTLERARRRLDPERTVVHVCTPPVSRLEILEQLADLGFRKILVEKPLASDLGTLGEIDALRRARGLSLVVVAHWLESELTRRLVELTRSGELGALRSISVAQHKPRLRRTLSTQGHPTAFDVELPHSVGVALRVAGNADVAAAELSDMRVGELVVPRMGSARLALRHSNGVRTEIVSDLTSPVRERRFELSFSGGRAVGHFAVSDDDHYAQLRLEVTGRESVNIFADDSLEAFFVRVYRDFSHGTVAESEFQLNMRVVELLSEAKAWCPPAELVIPEPLTAGVVGHAS